MIVGTKRSIAPYKEDERKVDGGIVRVRVCVYMHARVCVSQLLPRHGALKSQTAVVSEHNRACVYETMRVTEKYRDEEREKEMSIDRYFYRVFFPIY